MNDLREEYFEWLCDTVCGKRYSRNVSYMKLLTYLHSKEFVYFVRNDDNRAKDGINLRWRYSWTTGVNYDDVERCVTGPCSVLEMMVALAISCEGLMDDPQIGDRTGQWFWGMIVNLGLGSMTDERFDIEYVDYVTERFLNREYEPDGKGGLFTVKDSGYDLRKVEIWYQLCWYIDSII